MYKFLMMFGLIGAIACAQEAPFHVNLGFEERMAGWRIEPAGAAVSFHGKEEVKGANGLCAVISTAGVNSGLQTLPIALDGRIDRNKQYRITARLQNRGIVRGSFGFSVCYNNELGHRLKQHNIWSAGVSVRDPEWITRSIVIGADTSAPFPVNAQHLVIRFSFYHTDGKPEGSVAIDDIVFEEDKEDPTSWPASITVDCGDIRSRIESRSFWTMYRIDYKGHNICKDEFGSHYGTTSAYPGIKGFFGSGHTENAEENVLSKSISVDGITLENPGKALVAKQEVVLEKSTILHNVLSVDSKTVFTGKYIEEQVTVQAFEDTPMSRIYHFMHPWLVTMTDYLAVLPDGTELGGSFIGDAHMRVKKPVKWTAVYCKTTGLGAVQAVLAVPEGQDWHVIYWDKPVTYKKQYMVTFLNKTIPANKKFFYRMRTVPFEAEPEKWQATARAIANGELVK